MTNYFSSTAKQSVKPDDDFVQNLLGRKRRDKLKRRESAGGMDIEYSPNSAEYPKLNAHSNSWTFDRQDDVDASRYPHRREQKQWLSQYPKKLDNQLFDNEPSYLKAVNTRRKDDFFKLKEIAQNTDDEVVKNLYKQEKEDLFNVWLDPVKEKKETLQKAEQEVEKLDKSILPNKKSSDPSYRSAVSARTQAQKNVEKEEKEITDNDMGFVTKEAAEQKASETDKNDENWLSRQENSYNAGRKVKEFQEYQDVRAGKKVAPSLLSHSDEIVRNKKWEEYDKIENPDEYLAKLQDDSKKAGQQAMKPSKLMAGAGSVVQDKVGDAAITVEFGVNATKDGLHNTFSQENGAVQSAKQEIKAYDDYLSGKRWNGQNAVYAREEDRFAAKKRDDNFAAKSPEDYKKELQEKLSIAQKTADENKQETKITQASTGIQLKEEAEKNWEYATKDMSEEDKKNLEGVVDFAQTTVLSAVVGPYAAAGIGVIGAGGDKVFENVKADNSPELGLLKAYLEQMPKEMVGLVIGKMLGDIPKLAKEAVPDMAMSRQIEIKMSTLLAELSASLLMEDAENSIINAGGNKATLDENYRF